MRAYKANMIPGGVTPTINVSQYDNDYAVTVTLIEGAEIYTPPVGATIRVEGTKPDGHGFEYACTYQGNVVTMPIYTQMTVVAGRFPIELVVYQSGLRVGSCNIVFAVEKAPLGEDTDISETVIPDIIAGAQAQAEAAAASAASAAEAAAQVLSSQIVTEASGAVASFSDGADNIPMQSVVAEITPVQDLNGYSNPWSGGGGKNLIPYPYSSQAGTYNGITVTVNDDGTLVLNGTATAPVYFNLVANASGIPMTAGSYILHKPTTGDTGSSVKLTAVKNGSYWGNASTGNASLTLSEDANVSFYVNVDNGTTLSNVKVYPMFEKGTTASDWSPYENICPIEGRTGLTVTRAGKNLLNPSSATSRTVSGVTFTKNADGSITASGTATATIWYDIISNNENAVYFPAGSYILHPTYNSNIDIRVAKVGSSTAIASAKQTAVPFTLTEGAKLYALMVVTNGTTVNQTFYPMVTPSAISDSTYAPYNATEIPITWETEAGTVYGGTLDVVSGVLTVDKGFVTYDGSDDENWTYYSIATGNMFRTALNDRASQNISAYPNNYWCNAYKVATNATAGRTNGTFSGSTTNVDFVDDRYSTVEAWKTALADTPIQFVYPLATPQTYQLTPTEVRTLLGGNTIYTDAGDVSVEYVADTKLYIDNKIAELQALILEN